MFTQARIKLTFWYVLIIMFISLAFSGVIYRVLINELSRFEQLQRFRTERRLWADNFHPLPINTELLEETKHRILIMLFLTNLGILVSSGALAYFLAGRTLKPIQDMVDDQHRFVSDASHELKTPLTSLKSAFEVFLRDKKRTLKDADTIISESIFEVDKLQSLSESLLRLSQYQTTGKSLSFTSVQLGEVINTAIRRISPQAKIKNIEISSPLTAVSLTGDMSALTELMVILLDNAVKYSPNGKTVKIDTHSDSRWVKVTVADQGSGIPAADLPRIFDRFYRSDSARSKTDKGGYGLGLAIAKNIAAAHHGSIAVVSRLGQGSAFTVRIPLHPPFSTISVIAPKLHSHVA